MDTPYPGDYYIHRCDGEDMGAYRVVGYTTEPVVWLQRVGSDLPHQAFVVDSPQFHENFTKLAEAVLT